MDGAATTRQTPDQYHIPLFVGLCMAFLYMLFYFYDYFLQTSFSILPDAFLQAHHISVARFGLLSGAFFYGYLLLQIPMGFLLDRIGLKRVAVMCVALCVVGTTLFYFSGWLPLMFVARFMIGAGTACACVMAVYAVATWLNPRYFNVGVGVVQVAGCVGSIFGQAVESWFIYHFGWTVTTYVLVIFGLVLLLCYISMPKHPRYQQTVQSRFHMGMISQVLFSRQIWVICVCGFVCWGPISVLATSWVVKLLHHRYGITELMASNMTTALWIGLALTSLLVGKLSHWLRSRRQVVLGIFVVQLLCGLYLVLSTQANVLMLTLVLFLLGVSAAVQTFTFILTADAVSAKVYGSAAAMVNMAAVLSGAVINPIFGYLVSQTHSYQAGLWIFPSLSLLGLLVVWLWLQETYPAKTASTCG